MQADHERFIHETINLAEAAVAHGNEPFGSLLVKNGDVLLRVENTVYTGNDMTNHAEMNLVREALKQYDPAFLTDCTLYTSTEPCAMCAGAIYWSGIGRVVYGCTEQRLGEIAGIGLDVPCRTIFASGARKVDVVGPVCDLDAEKIHLSYWLRRSQ